MPFCEKLKQLRISAGLTQHSIAQQLQITDRSYQNYEYGKREPNIVTLIHISFILNVSLDDLLCKEEYQNLLSASVDES